MSLIYIFAATPFEARPIAKMIFGNHTRFNSGHRMTGRIGPVRVELFVCGAGPQPAQACARRVMEDRERLSAQPDAALVIGLCGALSPRLAEGTVVVYTECLSARENEERLLPSLAARLLAQLAAGGMTCAGTVGITSSRIAASKAEKRALATSGAEVVDMESYSILQVAATAAIPCAVLRVVSDSFDRRLPDFNPAFCPDGRISRFAAARIAARSPIRTAQLVLASRRAMQNLRPALAVILTEGGLEKI